MLQNILEEDVLKEQILFLQTYVTENVHQNVHSI